MEDTSILKIKNLSIELIQKNERLKALDNVSLSLEKGKTIGIIGESGSGKSLTCSSIMGLLDDKKWIVNGDIYFKNKFLPYRNNTEMNKFRGNHIAMITQNPMSAFNPLRTIGYHFIETLLSHEKTTKCEIEEKAMNILEKMHISNPKNVLDSYPFQLSGGMLQRVMIALAVILEPEIIIADEPTTALDLTVQREIINILAHIQDTLGTSIILVSHDLSIISELADEVLVIYGGTIVEKASVDEILNNPKHPYTNALIQSRPKFSKNRLPMLEGTPPSLFERGNGCEFYSRCNAREKICKNNNVDIININENHQVKCVLFKEAIKNCGTA
ncbi:ABC transporter ATP-binding protein [Terrisporobacter glycolicus]|uniref:D,D-dipeptide transport ATP-binding protein DdpD n=2 Tax=Clostridia TaxID=186801 RepID=A0ABZ2EYN2_9FIRM|nr:ABC transporter ATP-binding protein [Terrisporobacter glycolicus]